MRADWGTVGWDQREGEGQGGAHRLGGQKKFLGRKRQKSAKGRENREGRGGMDRKASGSVLAANAVMTNMAAGWARGNGTGWRE